MNHQYASNISPLSDSNDTSADLIAGSPAVGGFHHFAVNCVATVASFLSFQSGSQKTRVYEDYRRKMESYNGNIPLFMVSAIPSLVLLAPISFAYRSTRSVNRLIS